MKSLVLTAGQATRLRPLSYLMPKCFFDVKGKPILGHILDNLDSSINLDEILVSYHNDYKSHFLAFEKYYKYQKKLKFLNEGQKNPQEYPGLIGCIAHIVKSEKIEDDLLITAGDNLFDFPIDDFINFYTNNKRKTCIAVYEFKNKSDVAGKYGVVELKENGVEIASFEEKPNHPKTSLAATLCYILSKEDLHNLDKKIFKENAGELIKHLVENRQSVSAFKFRGKWFDIGNYDDLMIARREF
ncbi:MAG: nucleotidyltransferase family protein [Nanoarchaeota archaeon]